MPYSKIFMIALLIAMTACGQHKSENAGTSRGGDSFTGQRDKLISAIEEGDHATIQAMIKKGLDVNLKLANGRTPLIHATVQSRVKIINLLLKHGANKALTDSQNKTALDYAKDSGDTRAWLLLDAEKQIQEKAILIAAIKSKRLLKVGTQLENGTDPNFADMANAGETPLTLALELKASLIAERIAGWKDPLEITNTDVNLANQTGVRPLTKARQQSLSDLIQLLESLGAKE